MYSLELYTHPWCSDCQDSKQYLKKTKVPYVEHDLGQHPEKEARLKNLTGSKVVPGFVFKKKSLLGKLQKPTVFTGFERNEEEIKALIQKMEER
ncbi:glutaredoxin family protein [Shouchella shacheensis]|uniref:glutaredoxin family protein n=1 Tax=Shouchella shacheensis TaxID=1649580 RepID=UPI00073FDCDB|nr:glutaredoxin family protein [Shouchella shacheensis]